MEERQTFDHDEMEPASGSVSIPSPGFPIIKTEHNNFFIFSRYYDACSGMILTKLPTMVTKVMALWS